ncbi:pyridoxamine 5'-phosphate oxidase-like protein [Microdochium nivale]|nr:pyridoxamine 5'-phosphate oxidase-like protein [Microdochium nivale]
MAHVTLNHEASAGDTHKQVVTTLPSEVVQCLENARFLHLATCVNNQPHVSLMNYTYIPSSQYSSRPVIVMTSNPSSKKTNNMIENPSVSLLAHDWVSHRPPTHGRRPSGGSPGPEFRSSLASLLVNLNTSAVSSISATMNGTAQILDRGSEEEKYYREEHLENNTFDTEGTAMFNSLAGGGAQPGDGGREHFVAGEEVRVIVVHIKDVRTSDWKGGVKDWVIETSDAAPQLNGV